LPSSILIYIFGRASYSVAPRKSTDLEVASFIQKTTRHHSTFQSTIRNALNPWGLNSSPREFYFYFRSVWGWKRR
jgi:hypothetical protein